MQRRAGAGEALPKSEEKEFMEDCVDVWLVEMHYRVAVAYQSSAWEKASTELSKLFTSMKETECQRRSDLREYLVAFCQRQERLFISLPEIHSPVLQDLVGRPMDIDTLEVTVQSSIRKKAQFLQKEETKKPGKTTPTSLEGADSTDGTFMLESPLMSDMMCKSKVLEVRGSGLMGAWKCMLAVITADSFLHLFDVPSGRVSSGSAPEVAFQALVPKVQVPTKENVKSGKHHANASQLSVESSTASTETGKQVQASRLVDLGEDLPDDMDDQVQSGLLVRLEKCHQEGFIDCVREHVLALHNNSRRE